MIPLLFDVGHPFEETIPANLSVKQTIVLVERNPNHERFAHNRGLRAQNPRSASRRVVAIVAHHPVVVHLEGVTVDGHGR